MAATYRFLVGNEDDELFWRIFYELKVGKSERMNFKRILLLFFCYWCASQYACGNLIFKSQITTSDLKIHKINAERSLYM